MKTWYLNLPLARKQIFAFVLVGMLPMTLVALVSLDIARTGLEQKAFGQLQAVREIKAAAVSRYFVQVENQLLTIANSQSIAGAMYAFKNAFPSIYKSERLPDDALETMRQKLASYYEIQFGGRYRELNEGKVADIPSLMGHLDTDAIVGQYYYIHANPNPLGEKHIMDAAEGRALYHQSHNVYHPGIRDILEKFGYYDIFLVDIESGDIVYSVFKELDFGTSLRDGPYANTNFAEAFLEAAEMERGQISLKDFRPYTPSYEAPASFAATPIFNEGKKIGVLVFQMPLEPVNVIMTERAGMGESGETYLVGPDMLMRSDSYFDPESYSVSASFRDPENGKVESETAHAASIGKTGNKIAMDYKGNAVLSSYAPLDLKYFQWSILAEIDEAEAFASIANLTRVTILVAIISAMVIVAFAIFVSRIISKPIIALGKTIGEVERTGKFLVENDNEFHDEVGQTSRALNQLLKNLNGAIQQSNHVLEALGKGEFEAKVVESYPGQLGDLVGGVNQAIEETKLANNKAQEQMRIATESALEAEKAADKAQEQAQETLIIKRALDVSATSVMIADQEFRIIYQNMASEKLMRESEKDLQKELPQFNYENIVGSVIDIFHKNPAHQRDLLSALKDSYQTEIKVSGLTFRLSASPIRDQSGTFLGAVIEWIDRTEEIEKIRDEREVAEENARIRLALDNSSTGTMIADADQNIIYINAALKDSIKRTQCDLNSYFGQFDPNTLVGSNLSVFEREKGLDTTKISNLSTSEVIDVRANESSFEISTTPIVTEEHGRIGTMIEWTDRSDEVRIEKEIDHVIAQASKGDFGAQLNTGDKQGFFFIISQGLNKLLSTTNIAIDDVKRIFASLAAGDLSQSMEREYEGEFAKLKTDANNTILKLRDIIGDITESSSTIARASCEISQGIQSLGKRTEQQAASLEETAASMEEMTSTVKQSESSVHLANEMAEKSVDIARAGNESVEQTATSMAGISEASKKIENIIGVIDEIAFQTNLLALNAAVEAARAGEQGRGFAVVASEVRNLAQRSASAAKEIKGLIVDSASKVDEGSELVGNSDKTLKAIVAEIEDVSGKMDDLLNSAREQSSGIDQVTIAITHMDSMTQENAALVEEAMSASDSMASQAHKLDQLVSFFRR